VTPNSELGAAGGGIALILLSAACQDPVIVSERREGDGPAVTSTAREGASAASVDGGAAPVQTCTTTTMDLGVGKWPLPAGFCAHRVGEGDDLTTHIVDAQGRVRVRVTRLAHGAPVGDACSEDRVSVTERVVNGRRARVCTRSDGRRCYAFPKVANVCSSTAEDAALLEELIARSAAK